MSRLRVRLEFGMLAVFGGLLGLFLVFPIVSLFATTSLNDVATGLSNSAVVPALRLSLFTTLTSLALAVLIGTPLAWSIARSASRATRVLEVALQIPVVIPPAVAGVALLLTFGRHGLLTGRLFPSSWHLAFSTTAVVLAELFVSAPLFVQAAVSAFRRIDNRLLTVASSLGAYPWRVFMYLGLPLAAPALVAGAAMSWARALGEFGATLMFAGNLTGRTQTLPLAVYAALELDVRSAQAISIVLVSVAFSLLLAVRSVSRRENFRSRSS